VAVERHRADTRAVFHSRIKLADKSSDIRHNHQEVNVGQGGWLRVRDPVAMRAYLRLLGVSERELAERAGVGHATVNHLLSGRRSRCTERTAAAIEAALGCPPGLFFEPAARLSG
jgi:DNA-binding Xre family transcriptional regulator